MLTCFARSGLIPARRVTIRGGLSEAQKVFIDEFLAAKDRGDANPAHAAARIAYPNAKAASQKQMASQLLGRRTIQEEIVARRGTDDFVSVDSVVLGLRRIADDPKSGGTARVSAWKEIAILKRWRSSDERREPVGSQEKRGEELSPELVAKILATHERTSERLSSESD